MGPPAPLNPQVLSHVSMLRPVTCLLYDTLSLSTTRMQEISCYLYSLLPSLHATPALSKYILGEISLQSEDLLDSGSSCPAMKSLNVQLMSLSPIRSLPYGKPEPQSVLRFNKCPLEENVADCGSPNEHPSFSEILVNLILFASTAL